MATGLDISQLAEVPQCAYPAFEAIAAAGCGSDLVCICGNDAFAVTLHATILAGICSPAEIQASIAVTRSICTEAVPWLSDNLGPRIVAGATILSVIATLAYMLRVIARRLSGVGLGVDDWLLLSALIWTWGFTIGNYFSVYNGYGKHMLMVDLDELVVFGKCLVAGTIIFGVATTLLKLSFLFFYYRIFPIRRYTIASVIIGVFVAIYFLLFELTQFLQCRPFQYNWDKTIPNGRCANIQLLALATNFPLDILTNLAIMILPIPYLWNLQMRRSRKIAISFIFLLGSFAVIGSILRIPFYLELKYTEVTYTIVDAGIWLNVECNIGILSACLPVMRPLFASTFASTIRSRFSRSQSASRHRAMGSQRLPDTERGAVSNTSHKHLVDEGENDKHGPRSWYSRGVYAMGTKNDDKRSDGSEEAIPLGKIGVRHDVIVDKNERERRASASPQAV